MAMNVFAGSYTRISVTPLFEQCHYQSDSIPRWPSFVQYLDLRQVIFPDTEMLQPKSHKHLIHFIDNFLYICINDIVVHDILNRILGVLWISFSRTNFP